MLTLKRATYLISSLALGILWFTVLVTLLSTGLGLLITLVGLPILAFTLWVTRGMAQAERALAASLLGTRVPGQYRRPARPGWWRSFVTRLGDPQTYKDLVYLLFQLPLGILWFTVTVTLVAVGVGLLFAPAWYWAVPDGIDLGLFRADTLGEAFALVPAGAAVCVLARYAIDAMGIAAAAWARLMLTAVEDPQLTEVRSSQARMVEAGLAERRRLERDLHDGAQQRLVALSLKLGMARNRLPAEDGAAELVAEAHEESKLALAELRDLARGIHPAVLTERGLAAALEDLAARSTVPTVLEEAPEQRLSSALEATAYFVVAEGLANVTKYARAEHAWVSARLGYGRLDVEVRDDGAGGADPAKGSGLRGLADRVGALDGRIEVDSPPGAGTRVRAMLPAEILPEEDPGSSTRTTRARA
jgi:signal transduction histidine kinase